MTRNFNTLQDKVGEIWDWMVEEEDIDMLCAQEHSIPRAVWQSVKGEVEAKGYRIWWVGGRRTRLGMGVLSRVSAPSRGYKVTRSSGRNVCRMVREWFTPRSIGKARDPLSC